MSVHPGVPSKSRDGLTLNVKTPDSPDLNASGSVGIPSATQSATGSEISFEMSTKGSKKDKKKMKKKKKNKKEGKKKKADGRLNMSIDLEPGNYLL